MLKKLFHTAFLFLLLCAGLVVAGQHTSDQGKHIKNDPQNDRQNEANRIIDHNVQAAGGTALKTFKNIYFESENRGNRPTVTSYHATADGHMKIITGDGDLVEAITLVTPKGITHHTTPPIPATSELEKAELTCLATLCKGAFTLKHFKDRLTLTGIKKYGPESFHQLTMTLHNHDIEFFTDTRNHMLKRLVIKGTTPGKGRYTCMYDFGDPTETTGLKIPGSWYQSFIGPLERTNKRMTLNKLKINFPMDKHFFQHNTLHFGQTGVSPGTLTGQTIATRFTYRNLLLLAMNWTQHHVNEAGFKPGDTFTLTMESSPIGQTTFEGTVVADVADISPEDEDPAKKKIFLAPLSGDRCMYFIMVSDFYKPFHEKHRKLSKITIQQDKKNKINK